MWAEDAMLVAPMELAPAPLLPGEHLLARSYAGQAGTITFDFDLPCATSVEIHALVWDATSGIIQDNDPDSYVVSVDGGPEVVWTYGCGSADVPDQSWLWQRVASSRRTACDDTPLALDLSAGPHELVLLNRESGGGTVYAAIAAVVVTSDPSFDPATLYDPAG
jgi:hypothetical protein